MEKVSVCWKENCTNSNNAFDNCEDYLIEKISSVTIDDIIVLYEKLLLEYNLDYIDSTTSINWIPALDFLFTRLLNELFSCKKLSSIISEIQYLNAQVANWSQLPSLLKIQKSRIEKILYNNIWNFSYFLWLCRKFCIEYKSDIFVNLLIRFDAIYNISDYHLSTKQAS